MVRLDLNLLPPRKQVLGKQGRGILLALLFVFLLLVLVYIGLQGVVNSTRGQVVYVQSKLAEYGPFEQKTILIDQMGKQIEATEKYLGQVFGGLNDWYSVVIGLARKMPPNIALVSLNGNNNAEVNIKGTAPSAADISHFYENLQQGTTTASISLNSMAPAETGWTFDITYKYQKAVTP